MPFRTTMPRAAQPKLLRQINERTVFEMVRRSGLASRAQMKRAMGVSAPTVSKAVARLLRERLIETVGTAPHAVSGGAGRPVTMYRVAGRDCAMVLGVAIAVGESAVVASGLDGKVDERRICRFATPGDYSKLVAMAHGCARELIAAGTPGSRVLGIGVSAPGGIDPVHQRVLISPNLPMLNGQSPGRELGQALGVPGMMFHNMAGSCLAEQYNGEARNLHDFVRIGVYEGFGAAAVMNGRLLEGRHGLAGELGHVTVDPDGLLCGCGNRGCLETVATDTAFARALSRRIGRELDVKTAIQLALENHPGAVTEMRRMLSYLAIGVAAAINLYNPQAVFVSSRIFDASPGAFPEFKTLVATRTLPPLLEGCDIVQSRSLHYEGAAAGVIQHVVNGLGPALDERRGAHRAI